MMNKDYNVVLVDLPYSVPSLISYDDDDYPTILINARLSRSAQRSALDHEIDHDRHHDIDSNASIVTIESRGRAS